MRQDQINALTAEKEAIEDSYNDRIDALQDFLDEQNYQIDKANRESIESFEELRNELAKYGLDSAEYLGQATNWLNNYNSALSNLNNTVSNILSNSTVAQDGLVYSSATQERINQALSSVLPNITTNGLTLNGIDYDTLGGENNNTNTYYINSIELPNVKDIDDFLEALKSLPRLATASATQRT